MISGFENGHNDSSSSKEARRCRDESLLAGAKFEFDHVHFGADAEVDLIIACFCYG